ncbi:hypothetical protein Y032_0432g1350 [Ancylostoma ceylanicum]|nr:hypothetical protein Y032_0432g1350 [Ancylostoma ceylanicum]
MILRLGTIFFLLCILTISVAFRWKRDFMYVSDVNGTDADCFQRCNSKFQHDFEYSFNMSATVFYDFPFHPLVLDHNTFLLYCKLAEQRTKCYVEQCKDTSADTVFSPSNFICSFKRTHFTEVRQCLADAEPITFLKAHHVSGPPDFTQLGVHGSVPDLRLLTKGGTPYSRPHLSEAGQSYHHPLDGAFDDADGILILLT